MRRTTAHEIDTSTPEFLELILDGLKRPAS